MSMPLLLLVSILSQSLGEARLPTPVLTHFEPGADTVWLYGRPQPESWQLEADADSAVLAYAYPRDAARWVRAGRAPARNIPARLPATPDDTVRLTDRFDLVRLTNDAGNYGERFAAYAIRSRRTGRLHPVRLGLSRAERRAAYREAGFERSPVDVPESEEVYPVVTGIGGWVAHDGAVWIGLQGGVTAEGYGGLGGLLRFDLAGETLEVVDLRHLGFVSVTGMAAAAGELWIGTLFFGEGGISGTGLFRHDPATGTWRRYTADSHGLPDDAIWTVADDGSRVWISTRQGPAVLDIPTGEWTSFHFEPALEEGEVVHLVHSGAATRDSARLSAFILMERLGVERRAAFLEAARPMPSDWWRPLATTIRGHEVVLADRAFLPFLLNALRRGGRSYPAAGALALLSRTDPSIEASVREVLAAEPPADRVGMAESLARSGLEPGFETLRELLRGGDAADHATRSRAIEAAGRLRDAGSVPALAALVDQGEHRRDVLEALLRIATADAWRPVGDVVREKPAHWHFFLRRVNSLVYYGSRWREDVDWDEPVFRRLACDVAHRTLRDPAAATVRPARRIMISAGDSAVSGEARPAVIAIVQPSGPGVTVAEVLREAAVLLTRLHDPAGPEALIALLADDPESAAATAALLAKELPAASAPRLENDDGRAQRLQTHEFWRTWWERHQDEAGWNACNGHEE